MRVLITGGGGFIGAWVVRQLLAMGINPRVMELGNDRTLLAQVLGRDPSGVEWISGDISRRDDLEEAVAGCDRIIHLAGALGPLCHTNPPRAAEINYVGTLHVFTLAKERALPVVYASTALVHATDGNEPVGPSGHYGIFKLASELSADVFWREHGLSTDRYPASRGVRLWPSHGEQCRAQPCLPCRGFRPGLYDTVLRRSRSDLCGRRCGRICHGCFAAKRRRSHLQSHRRQNFRGGLHRRHPPGRTGSQNSVRRKAAQHSPGASRSRYARTVPQNPEDICRQRRS